LGGWVWEENHRLKEGLNNPTLIKPIFYSIIAKRKYEKVKHW
jgi:hypothetical protein